ncbi:MAG: DNA translocase FtsK [Candidatus Omnitrophota bacterium]|nr:DNA translocase FtsK [Candidatus Omnitrophota bacterium]
MKEKRINEIKGVILIAAGLIFLASLISYTPYDLSFYTSHPNNPPKNLIRSFGAYSSGISIFLFGQASFILPFFVLWLGMNLFRQKSPYFSIPKIIGIAILVLSASSLVGILPLAGAVSFRYAGFFGFNIANFISIYFGKLGGYILFITLIILSFALTSEILVSTAASGIIERFQLVWEGLFSFFKRPLSKGKKTQKPFIVDREKNMARSPKINNEEPVLKEKFKLEIPLFKSKVNIKSQEPKEIVDSKPKTVNLKSGTYQLPSLDLLDSPPPLEARQIKDDLANNARILEDTLGDFNISVKVTDIERGPNITRYELEPAPGVKLNRIVALNDDIALAMKAQSVRIVAPIPGKGKVGVEVPNSQSTFVYLKEVLASQEFQKSDAKLPLTLGKDISGQAVIADLGQMPHLLIAGTTGSGKTVCVNSLIVSLLYKASPDELKFLMIDPKMVELAPFNGLPHLLCPVVTEAKKAAVALNWVVNEMEERYRLLAELGVRNIEAYNQKKELLPYIVVIIDEFADLMMIVREQVESAITRLAQLSRAVGIHLILATQRPSVNVITGVIKANLPARISFKVASKVDSRTVLDMNGADKLLGKGDMLFLKPQDAKLLRAQATLVMDNEIERVVDFIKTQAEPVYNDKILKEQQHSVLSNGEKDDLYDEAVCIIMESNQASVSILQRRMRLGYTRAARIIDVMEQEGLVGPFEGSKPRKILVDRKAWLEKDIVKGE